jgi:hypothetical protein
MTALCLVIVTAGLAVVAAAPALSQETDPPRVTHAWVHDPFVGGEIGELWVKVTAPGREVIALDVDFGDGRREILGRSCESDAPPSGRGRFTDLRHRYERLGVFTITVRAIATASCGSADALEIGPTHATRVRAFPPLVKVPRVVPGLGAASTCTLRRHGLRWRYSRLGPAPFFEPCAALRASPPSPVPWVEGQLPEPGTKVRPGTVVELGPCTIRRPSRLAAATWCPPK